MFKKLLGAKKSPGTSSDEDCCKYLPFKLQPLCTSNRHLHADIVNRSRDIRIMDVDRNKQFLFKNIIERGQELQHKRLLPHGLSECNLIAYHFDLAVIQVFCQDAVHIYICNCSTQKCTHKYVLCPCVSRRPGLCEAYFSSNRTYLILKASEPYILYLSAKHQNHLEKNFLEIVKLEAEGIVSIHFDTAHLPFQCELSELIIPYGVCAVPDRPSEIIISLWEDSFSRLHGHGKDLWSIRARLRLVGDIGELQLFRKPPSFGPIQGLHRCHECLDVLVNSFSIFGQQNNRFVSQESIIMNPSSVYRKFFAGVIRQCNFLLQSCVTTQKMRLELACRLVDSVVENFGHKRVFSVVSDGKPAFYTPETNSVKTLQTSCINLLRGIVLPEDRHLLPLPQKLVGTLCTNHL